MNYLLFFNLFQILCFVFMRFFTTSTTPSLSAFREGLLNNAKIIDKREKMH